MITALAAVGALVYTGQSLAQNSANATAQNKTTESGQITDRFNAAVTNLGSGTETIRIGGIYALQRIMTDSPRDQPAAIQVLAAFIREHAPLKTPTRASTPTDTTAPAIDLQTALTVLGDRDPTYDQEKTVDLDHTDLAGANLYGANLTHADFADSDLTGAHLTGANLTHASFASADLTGANLYGANLTHASFAGANLTGADLADAVFADTHLTPADASGADFAGAPWCAGLSAARPGGYRCIPTGTGGSTP